MKEFFFMFNINHWTVTGFYPYTSSVICRLFAQSHNYKVEEHDFLDTLGASVKQMAEDKGCSWDNKVVVEITYSYKDAEVPAKLYIGWYDGRWSVGIGVSQDDWLKDRNKHF